MKKILISLGLVSLVSVGLNADDLRIGSFNPDLGLKIKTDDFNNVKVDLNLFSNLTDYENVLNKSNIVLKTTDFKSVGFGIDNKLLIGTNNYDWGFSLEKFNTDINKDAEFKIYGGYITQKYNLINKDMNFYVGVEYTNEFKPFEDKSFISYRFGTYINNDLYLGIKSKDTDKGIDNIIQASYKF